MTEEIVISQEYISENITNVVSFAIWSSEGEEHDNKIYKHSAPWAVRGIWKSCKWDTEERSLQSGGEACA